MRSEEQQQHRHAHRYPGAKRRVRIPLVDAQPEPPAPVKPEAPPQLHRQLRAALQEGPLSLGQLRRSYGWSPVLLLNETIGAHPETYVETDVDGHPGLGLREDAPPLDVMLDRRQVMKVIEGAGQAGVYLSTLHKATGFTSNHIVELLEDAPGVERELREKRPLYRSSISIIEEMNTEVSEDDLETGRDRLIALLGNATRMSHWLEDQHEFDHALLVRVLERYQEDFVVEEVRTGVSTYIMIRCALGPHPEALPSTLGEQSSSASQAGTEEDGSPQLLQEIMSPDDIETLQFRPAAPGMGSRRNDRRTMRGDRFRLRTPLVQL